ncbi:MAG: sugar ABC transporter permease [Lachnospiraceae bacterium]|jgi:ABC-type sugar transport system permease subunit|nr:sugar ABC transporter permease [Lachnospiraceae bacterium]MCI9589698.1 sugar ABC transporter permease [Lachnospiraceae bacterium]MDE6930810.1 sugar ABC transporter permease [Lachnospiraceae bacterium]
MNKKSTRMGYLMLLPSVLLILVLILYPTVNTIYQSFFEIRTQTAALGPKFVGFRNYVKAFQDEHFWDTLWWTLAFTAVSVALELIIGMGLALLMNRKIPGQGLIRTAVLIPWGIPTVVSGIIWTQFFAQNGIVNSTLAAFNLIKEPLSWLGNEWLAKLSILIADVWKNTPYMSLLLLSGLLTISRDYYEAAEIDGAGKFRQFTHITLPLIKATMSVTVLFRIISAMRVYDLIVAMTAGGPAGRTETVSMYAVNTYFTYGNTGYGATLSVLMLIISVGISMFFVDSLKTKGSV